MQNIDVFMMMSRWVFLIALGYYVIINLQWYHYRLSRVLFKHHKQRWHFFYFLVPVLYFVFIPENVYFYFGFYLYIFVLIIWALCLSKGLVLTGRVLRFFGLYLIFVLFNELLLFGSESSPLMRVVYLLPLIISVFLSSLVEGILLSRYKKIAIETLKSMPNLTIIAVTGSYGKTSLKNFLVQVLQDEFKVYATPRSVNTLTGIIADINQNLSSLTDIYIVEAGARRIGDIKEIVDLINPQIAVIGKIGPAHIEYFKSLDNIYKAKYEILQSPNLQKVYNYKDNTPPQNFYGDIAWYPQNISNVDLVLMDATLPNMNGVEASKVIKNKYPFIKIVILVPYNSDKQVISTLFANADSYYIRDLGQDMLYDVLTQTLADNGSIDKRIQFSVFNYIKRLPEKDYWKILNKLTTEESNFITFVYMGLSRDEISDRLGVSSAQLSNFIYSIFEKLVHVVKFGQFDKELVYDLF